MERPPERPPEASTEAPAAVLIPARDCADGLAGVLAGLAPLGLPVTVVDDGSRDATASVARRGGAVVLEHGRPRGKGAALRSGLSWLLAARCPPWILFMDGDGQHLPSEAPRFLEAMAGGDDCLLGSRMAEAGLFPRHRLNSNRVSSLVVRVLSGQGVPDSQCGFRAFRTDLLRRMTLVSEGFDVETEMLLKALRMGARWRVVPVSAVYAGERSHYRTVADTLRIALAMVRHGLA
jgi:glycosyltransferase involved in cell wall biosynthesis